MGGSIKGQPLARSMHVLRRKNQPVQVDQVVAGSGSESQLSRLSFWSQPYYSTQAEYFIALVRIIFDGGFHEDQVKLRGQSALECLYSSELLLMYPNAQLCQLVGNFLTGVRPLSCLDAQAIRRHKLPFQSLPMLLKYMVLHHKHQLFCILKLNRFPFWGLHRQCQNSMYCYGNLFKC